MSELPPFFNEILGEEIFEMNDQRKKMGAGSAEFTLHYHWESYGTDFSITFAFKDNGDDSKDAQQWKKECKKEGREKYSFEDIEAEEEMQRQIDKVAAGELDA